jgi:hypothetical protein
MMLHMRTIVNGLAALSQGRSPIFSRTSSSSHSILTLLRCGALPILLLEPFYFLTLQCCCLRVVAEAKVFSKLLRNLLRLYPLMTKIGLPPAEDKEVRLKPSCRSARVRANNPVFLSMLVCAWLSG